MGNRVLFNTTGADPTGTGTTALTPSHIALPFPEAHAEVTRVIVEGNGSLDDDTGFNVQLGGDQVFSTEQTYQQSDDPNPVGYTPDQNAFSSAEGDGIDFEVTTADPSAGTVDVTVVVEDSRT